MNIFYQINQWMDRQDVYQSVDTKSLSTFGLYKDQLGTQILKIKYQLGIKSDS